MLDTLRVSPTKWVRPSHRQYMPRARIMYVDMQRPFFSRTRPSTTFAPSRVTGASDAAG
jgi:hypothetical protein